MYEERDKKRFVAFTEALLSAGKRNPEVRNATTNLCGAIVRVTVSPSHRFDDAKSDLTNSAYALDAAISGLNANTQSSVRRIAPLFLSELRCAHEPRLRNVCGGVVSRAASIWATARRTAKA